MQGSAFPRESEFRRRAAVSADRCGLCDTERLPGSVVCHECGATYPPPEISAIGFLHRHEAPTGEDIRLLDDVLQVGRMETEAIALRRGRRLRPEPTDEIVMLVESLMETLAEWRDELALFDRTGKLKNAFEMFRCQLQESGFSVRFERKQDRARAHRRLGEVAEARGDVAAALLHYDLAVRSWKGVGCARSRDKLAKQVS